MKKAEKNMIFQEAALMSDEKLKEAYYQEHTELKLRGVLDLES